LSNNQDKSICERDIKNKIDGVESKELL